MKKCALLRSDNNAFSQVEVFMRQVIAFHHQGNVMQARILYEEIVSREPDHVDTLHCR